MHTAPQREVGMWFPSATW